MPLERIRKAGGDSGGLLLLSLCFAAGAAFGQLLALGVPDAVALEVQASLSDYCRSRESAPLSLSAALPTLAAWLRAPALAFLWGFTPLGVPLACLTATAFGFLLSFSLGCFAAAFGWQGAVLGAAAMGLRVLITLPCFFLLSLTSMERAAWLFRLSAGRVGRTETRPKRGGLAAFCTLILLAGAALDLRFTPRLLRLTLDWLSQFSGTGFP